MEDCKVRAAIVILVVMAFSFSNAPGFAEDYLGEASKKINQGRLKSASRYLARGASSGDERCEFILGLWALTGVDGKRDTREASRRIQRAAKSGLLIAQSNLGLLYASGDGVKQNAAKAAEWYRMAAESGDSLGQAALGAAIFLGAGVQKDTQEALVWTSLAAAQGNQRARAFLKPMQAELGEEEIARARTQVAEFRAKETPEASRWHPSAELLNPVNVANAR
jgi:hypothetical protein